MKRIHRVFLLAGLLACVSLSLQAASAKSKLKKRIETCEEFVKDIMDAPDTSIPSALLRDCKGIIILRQYKAGFVIGVKGGHGVVMVKDDKGAWSPPAFVRTGEGSIGWQIGGQAVDAIILIMNKDGLDMLLKTKFKIGGDASVAAGPLGRTADAKIGAGTALLSYSRSKGLFAGASLEGGVMLINKKENATYYDQKELTAKQILFKKTIKTVPEEAKSLAATLKKMEGTDETKKK